MQNRNKLTDVGIAFIQSLQTIKNTKKQLQHKNNVLYVTPPPQAPTPIPPSSSEGGAFWVTSIKTLFCALCVKETAHSLPSTTCSLSYGGRVRDGGAFVTEHSNYTYKSFLFLLLSLLLNACSTTEAVPTARPTRIASAPTLQASPTFRIQSSGELYALETPSGSNNAASAALPSGQYAPPIVGGTSNSEGVQRVEVVLSDGTVLTADLYETSSLGRVPGLILLGSDPLSWGALPQTLRGREYTVLVLSLPRTDYPVEDFQSLLETMSLVGSVNPAQLAVIAELDSANWALEGCAAFELCDALALFSPTNRERTQAVINQFAPRPLLIAAAQDDAVSYPVALNLAGVAQASTVFVEETTGSGAGLLVLSNTLQPTLLNWLDSIFKVG